MPEAFALVREASKRINNERHFDVQLIGGVVLYENKIAEMKMMAGTARSMGINVKGSFPS